MWTFITGLLIAVLGTIFVLRFSHQPTDRHGNAVGDPVRLNKGLLAIPLVIGISLILVSFTAIVNAKNVGVVRTFGAVHEKSRQPGLNFKAPWSELTEIDGTIQTDEYNGDNCIYVRIGDGSRACVTLANRWQVVDENANDIYAQFRTDDPTKSLRDAVVSTQLKAAVQEVLAKYNPVADLSIVGGEEAASKNVNFAPDYDQVSRDIEASLTRRQGDTPLIEVESITVSYVSLSESTQAKIDQFVSEVAKTRIASQQVETNKKIAEANDQLSASLNKNPNVLVSRCFDLVEQGKDIGFSCWQLGGDNMILPQPQQQSAN